MDITQFYGTFFDEADELLAEMELLLLGLDVQAPDGEQLNAIFRAAHSIKGGAAAFNFVALTETTHLLENLLDRARHGELRLRKEMIDVFLETKDVLQTQLSAYRAGDEPDPQVVTRICAVLQQLALEESDGARAAADAASTPALAVAAVPSGSTRHPPPPDAAGGSRLQVRLLRISEDNRRLLSGELANLGKVIAETQADDSCTFWLETTCEADDIAAVCCFIIEPDQIEIVREQAESPGTDPRGRDAHDPVHVQVANGGAVSAASAVGAGSASAGKEAGSIRVDIQKVDQIINLVGELVITQSMLTQNASMLDPKLHDRLLTGMGQLERNARDLQESVMSIRMMPMDYVFSRFPRLLRELSAKLGKQVQLATFGKATELDKGLIERIVDPLTHLVRNSLDHGIEKPEQRIAAGKDPVGQLLLSAKHQGGNIIIEVSDDGNGLNRDRILAKAMQNGLTVDDTMSDDEVWQLIFVPGFSTAEKVTDVSGRGVGMDVVKRNIQEMGGRVEIESQKGRGTTTRIVVPLTLAILDGMSVRVGNEIYIVPLSHVIESLQPRAQDIHLVTGGESVIHVRGDYLRLVKLHSVFGVLNARVDPVHGVVVIVHAEGKRFALLVDELVGQHQVVVKNLETNYRKVYGISAATIFGDGSVALILDVAALQHAGHEALSVGPTADRAAKAMDAPLSVI